MNIDFEAMAVLEEESHNLGFETLHIKLCSHKKLYCKYIFKFIRLLSARQKYVGIIVRAWLLVGTYCATRSTDNDAFVPRRRGAPFVFTRLSSS
ncbi:unnamed protein product [Leptidea sinapis]|uniref:Uncharacterized protein n=1 Tax=Leptidea sinapis TaxID=189913 RepID=A0A5E4QYG9_9NEOP|nr:unnamed protein product [Leptidea sinapis]